MGTTINSSNSPFIVSSGSTETDDTVVAGGTMIVVSGADAFGNTASGSGAYLWIAQGGSTSNNFIGDGAQFEIGVGFTSSGGGGGSTYIASGPSFDEGSTASGSGAFIIVGNQATATSDTVVGPSSGAGAANELVFSGGTASATTVSAGGKVAVEGGLAVSSIDEVQGALLEIVAFTSSGNFVAAGTGSGNIVNNGGAEVVKSGGVDSVTSVGSDGYMAVSVGGLAISATLSGPEVAEDLGTLAVFSGGVTSGTDIEFGGNEVVTSDGTAISTIVGYHAGAPLSDGGLFLSGASGLAITGASGFFSGGGTASDTIIESTGREGVFSGGLDISASIQSGGTELVFSGGVADSPVVSQGGELDIGIAPNEDFQFTSAPGGGLVNGATIALGADDFVWAGGTDSGGTIDSDGSVWVESGGVEINPVFSSGGEITVSLGGELEFLGSDTTISDTSQYQVFGGATLAFADGAVYSGNPTAEGEVFVVGAGGTTLDVGLSPGDIETILSTGVTSNGLFDGTETVLSGGTVVDPNIGDGILVLMSGGTVSSPQINGGELSIAAGGIVDGGVFLNAGTLGLVPGSDIPGVTFGSGAGTLVIGGSSSALSSFLAGLVLSNFALGDTIDLFTVPLASGATLSSSGSALTISEGGESYTLNFNTAVAGTSYVLSSAGNGSTELIVSSSLVSTTLSVTSGETSSGIVLLSGGTLDVLAGGSALETVISYGGSAYISSGGFASGTMISFGGTEIVSAGTDTTTVGSGGTLEMFGDSADVGFTLDPGANVEFGSGQWSCRLISNVTVEILSGANVSLGSLASGGSVIGGDVVQVEAGGTATSATVAGGTLYVAAGGTAEEPVLKAGTVDLDPEADVNGVTFSAGTGTLQIGGSSAVLSSFMAGLIISSFDIGDILNLPDITFSSGATAVRSSGATLSITIGGSTYTTVMTSDDVGDTFIVTSDAVSGIDVTIGQYVTGTLIVSSGRIDGGLQVESGGMVEVLSGGTTTGTNVASGGEEFIGSSGRTHSTQIAGGGVDLVFGSALGTVLRGTSSETATQYDFGLALGGTTYDDGLQLVESGASASGMTVELGGEQYVGSGGTTLAAQIEPGGAEVVVGIDSGASLSGTQYLYGTASGGTTFNGGYQLVAFGAVANRMTVSSGGYQYIGSGGTAIATDITSQGAQIVFGSALGGLVSGTQYDFAFASGGTTYNGGDQLVAPGATAIGMTVESGGQQFVGSGGTAVATDIAAQGVEEVFGLDSGALNTGTQYVFRVASGGTVFASGYQAVEPGSTAISLTVSSGGQQDVGSGGTATDTRIMSQGFAVVGGTDLGAIISGTEYILGGLASGSVVASGGYLMVGEPEPVGASQWMSGTISAVSISGGTIELTSGAADGAAPITFAGAGELILDASTSFSGTIAGFDSASQGDSIDFADIAYVTSGSAGATTVNWTSSGSGSGTLTVSEGGHTANITLLGQYTGTFSPSADGTAGTLITYSPVNTATDHIPSVLTTTRQG